MDKIAFWQSAIVVEFDDEDTTPEEALEAYMAENDISESFTLMGVQDAD